MKYPIIIKKSKAISLSFFLLHNSLILFITYDFSITNNITVLFTINLLQDKNPLLNFTLFIEKLCESY